MKQITKRMFWPLAILILIPFILVKFLFMDPMIWLLDWAIHITGIEL